METLFLACFLFGVVFTVLSLVLGAAGHAVGSIAHFAHDLQHDFHVGHHPTHVHVGGVDGGPQHGGQPLFLFGFSSLVAFLTWFGAAGYVVVRWTDWPLAAAVALGVGIGIAGGVIVARFLGALRAAETVMDPADYRLVGTVARVTVGIPAGGVGEIVFAKGGRRRSEAARAPVGRSIARETEVVVTGYERGVAMVQPWDELYAGGDPPRR
jgi:hypothetical protein